MTNSVSCSALDELVPVLSYQEVFTDLQETSFFGICGTQQTSNAAPNTSEKAKDESSGKLEGNGDGQGQSLSSDP